MPESKLRPWGLALTIGLLAVLAPAAARGQETDEPSAEPPALNTVYFELLGNGGLFSVDYDRTFAEDWNLRVGVGSWKSQGLFGDSSAKVLSVPVTVSWLGIGSGSRRLELGGGIVAGSRDHNDTHSNFLSLTAIVGYRLQPRDGGFVFRVGWTPFYAFGNEDTAYPDPGFENSVGVSFGAAF